MSAFNQSIYCVFKSRTEFKGTDVVELYPGDFAGPVKWWNPGSLFIRKEGFELFVEIFTAIAPKFDIYSETRIAGVQLAALLRAIENLGSALQGVKKLEDLRQISNLSYAAEGSALIIRAELIRATASIAAVVSRARDDSGVLWVLGL